MAQALGHEPDFFDRSASGERVEMKSNSGDLTAVQLGIIEALGKLGETEQRKLLVKIRAQAELADIDRESEPPGDTSRKDQTTLRKSNSR